MTLSKVNERISKHESEWGRDAGSVVLIAVSKVQPVEKIEKVLKAGHKDFGENRVQEALDKWPKLKGKYPKINFFIFHFSFLFYFVSQLSLHHHTNTV